ncbi:MAG: adenosylmethionine--8-amino-7-oxononanoate transaminase [Nitrospirae bacterium]|nr:adenosylmethionine--8-amino-7-oxononanoate transaminase [Nitrospirota bacterium]MCL5421852.1 adenosylmethionine--8-amino-7-oxononanoate transaminase [Nitrospirota bacterium]
MGTADENRHLEELDRKYIWHPFTQMKDWLEEKPVIISEGRDCFLKDIYGNWYLDGVSSLWVNIHGHRKEEIDDAVKQQLDRIAHSTMLGLSSVPAIQLAERLVKLVEQSPPHPPLTKGGQEGGSDHPLPPSKVFYSDNGSTAVEVALKMAFQYWIHKGIGGKVSFLSLKNGYHGDTLGAVSVGGIDIFHRTYEPFLFKTYKAPSPYCYRCELHRTYPDCAFACLNAMEEILKENSERIAAVIIEPLVQAAGGMIVAPPGYLKGVRELCTKYDVLMIADEVATGFGRTGIMFACEHEGVVPNIICLSKGITGGYLPLAATMATEEIYKAFLGEFKDLKTFFHGHSYTGNPLGCAAALACLDIFEKEKTLEGLGPKIGMLEAFLKDIAELGHVGDVRNKGLIAGIELVKDKSTKEPYPWEEKMGWRVAYYAREHGVFIRPLGNVVVVMPPLSISLENLEQLLKVIREGIKSVTE